MRRDCYQALWASLKIGVENSAALEIDLGEQTHRALFGKQEHATYFS